MDDVRLTSFSHGAGCACKLGPGDLAQVLGRLDPPAHPPEVLVASETGDDAAVYRLPDGTCLIQTVDFFTPIVDDPFDWGRIAAANALSDVYAMGGRPALALNVVAWPVDDLPLEMLAEVLRGGAKVAAEAGASVVGGHTIHDPEPKYGMAVTGFAEPERITRNDAARPGDLLYLTKPLGIGIVTTAIKRGVASASQVATAVQVMTTLNAQAAAAVAEVGGRAVTDVTGFGLLGHLRSMLAASGVAADVDAGAVPVVDGALDLARHGVVPGGSRANHRFLAPHVDWGGLPEPEQHVLADAQTSGGLLVAIPQASSAALERAFEAREVPWAGVGAVRGGEPGSIEVRGTLGADPSERVR